MIVTPLESFGVVHPLVKTAASIGAWVAGGALRCVIDGTDLHDIDLFFRAKDQSAECESYFAKHGGEVAFRCPRGELVSMKIDGVKVQFCMIDFYNSTEVLLDTFDFQASRFALSPDMTVSYPEEAKTAAEQKMLFIHRITYPAATLLRMQKYISYGYKLNGIITQAFIPELADHPEIAGNTRVYVD